MYPDITSSDNVINSRMVEERITELENNQELDIPEDQANDEEDELDSLRDLREQCDGQQLTLINDSYFTDYARELAEDIHGDIFTSWPCESIDWDEAADQLKIDYTEIEWDGVIFWHRS